MLSGKHRQEDKPVQVSIKSFDVGMQVKNNGIEFEVYSPNGEDHLGDLVLTKTRLIWCEGRTTRENGIEVNWNQFIRWMNAREA